MEYIICPECGDKIVLDPDLKVTAKRIFDHGIKHEPDNCEELIVAVFETVCDLEETVRR